MREAAPAAPDTWAETLLDGVTRALSLYFRDVETSALFDEALGDLLSLTDSDYGYIAEVLFDDAGAPYLKTWAITNIAWNHETRVLYEQHIANGGGLEFRNLDTLFGWGLLEGGRVVVANDTSHDPRSSGRPEGHPPLDSFLGVPILRSGELIGQFGVANRAGGYDEALVERLAPFTAVLGNLIEASRSDRVRRAAEARALQRAVERNALMDNLRDAVLFVDHDRRVMHLNTVFCELFGYEQPPAELVGQLASSIRGRAAEVVRDPEVFDARIEAIYAAPEPVTGERIDLRDGRVLERDYVPVAIEGQRVAHLWLYREVTERVEIEEQRQRMIDDERAIRRAVEEQHQALQELDRMKDELIATVSHELRTPLTAIVSFAALLVEDSASLSDEHREFVSIIDHNAQRLARIVGDLLLLTRLEAGTAALEVERVDVGAIVELAVKAILPEAAERDVDVTVDVASGRPVSGDSGRLEQVVTNLVMNAVKYTHPGGRVEVMAAPVGDRWRIEVRDTGVGIPADDLSRVFEPFFRAANVRDLATPGTGLGLAVSRAIVELHHGTLTVDSTVGRGTSAVVTIPMERASGT